MKANEHQELNFLLKSFAWFGREADIIVQFERLYGKQPTRKQLAYANLEKYLDDRRKGFKDNHRVRKFRAEREKAKAAMRMVPIADKDWRLNQYQIMYERAERRSQETGNTNRCTDILVLAAKDAADFYTPKQQNFTIDNRRQIYNGRSDDDITKTLNKYLKERFGVILPPLPMIEQGEHVIDGEAQDDSE